MRLANGVAKILSFDELKPVFSDFTTGIFSSFLMISTTSCLFSASLVSISEEYDIEISEDCTVSDLFDCLYEFFKDDESFILLEKGLSLAQKKAYAKRSKEAKKNKGPENTAKVTAKKKVKTATTEKPEVKPATTEKPEVKPSTSEKPEGPSNKDKIEKLRVDIKSISSEIKTNRDKLNNLDTTKPESKSVSDSLNATINDLEKKKLPLDKQVAKKYRRRINYGR